MAIQAFDKEKGYWFTGNGSFVSNEYVIYANGLDGNPPNPIATKYGNIFNLDYIDKRRGPFEEFISLLTTAAERAAINEKLNLKLKLQQLRRNNTAGFDVLWFDKIEDAIKQEDYSAAYTLLMRRDRDIEKFAQELSAAGATVAHSTTFYNSQFANFLKTKLDNFQQWENGFSVGLNNNVDFEEMVNEYFTKVLNVNLEDNISAQLLRDKFVDDLQAISDASGGQIGMAFAMDESGRVRTIKGSAAVIKTNKKTGEEKRVYIKPGAVRKSLQESLTTQKGQFRNPNQLIEAVAEGIARMVGRGLSGEAYNIGTLGKLGGNTQTISTGMMRYFKKDAFGKNIGNVQVKEDLAQFEVYGAELDLDKLAQSIFGEMSENYTKENMDEYRERLKDFAAKNGAATIFDIQFNVKSYISNMDLKIEGQGPFKNRVAVLQAEGISDLGEKLIFMLNNTADGAIFNGKEGIIEDYLATVCAAWMWDRPEELFHLDLNTPYNYRVIKLFNSGSAYYTASQIIYQTIDRLKGYSDNRFVKVNITPPPTYGNYTNLMKDIPIEGHPSTEWQGILKQRWDIVKQDAMTMGQISVEFDQRGLDQLLGNLRAILNAK